MPPMTMSARRDHVFAMRRLDQRAERRRYRALVRQGRILDEGRRRFVGHSAGAQILDCRGHVRQAHIDDDRLACAGESTPVGTVVARSRKPRGEDDGAVDAAHRRRDARRGQPAEGRSNAGQDAERNIFRRECRRLLAAAREHIGMAALQPHHLAALSRQPDQYGVDLALRDRQPPAALADEEFFRLFSDGDGLVRNQRIMHKRVGLGERGKHIERQQAGVARTGAGQPDMAGFEHWKRWFRRAMACSRLMCAAFADDAAFVQAYRSPHDR